jgi:putative transposase
VFFTHGDYASYLSLLRHYSIEYGVDIIAYCLMPNHVHHVLVPSDSSGLHRLFKAVHGQFAQRINRTRSQVGHLWQGRYFSSPLDTEYLVNAVRYVELNPVRAGLVERAENFDWSSAPGHCGLRRDIIVRDGSMPPALAAIHNWSRWLAEGVADDAVATLRRQGTQNLPCGDPEFVAGLERLSGVRLQYASHGGARSPPLKPKRGAIPSLIDTQGDVHPAR